MRDRLAITGVGVVGPAGFGMPALAAALERGVPLRSPIAATAARRIRGCAEAALVPAAAHDEMREFLDPRSARRMSVPSRFAVAAAGAALADAGCGGGDRAETAVGLATTFGAAAFTERILDEILEQGPELVSPFLFTDCVANAPAGQIAIAHGARAANGTIVAREAGALAALAWGAREVRAGRAARALAGAVDELTPLLHAILDRLGALAPDAVARPFDRRRCGRLAGEGASVVVLEPGEAARARKVAPRAWLVGAVSAFDPGAAEFGFGREPEQTAVGMREALARLGAPVGSVDAVLSGAGGTRIGDAYEAALLRALFEGVPPPILGARHVVGDYGAGMLPVALHLLGGGRVARAQRFVPDPALGLELSAAAPSRLRRLLVTGVASGGCVELCVLEAP